MSRLSFKEINKAVLLITLISLASNLEKGSFSLNFIPSPFQILLVISVVLTAVYVLKNHQVKDFFLSVPRKILLAIGSLFFSIFLGWIIAIFFLEIPTTIHTILDFGTFMMGIVLFSLVLFYTKNDKKYAKWCLFALLIPNFHLLYYFLSHGMVGYWGVPNDLSLDYVLDPNILSKTLLVPSVFFISMSLYTLKNKNWRAALGYIIAASVFSMLVFWTVSRGSLLSLIVGSILVWLVFSLREFTGKKFFSAGLIILIILLLGYAIVPNETKEAISVKVTNTVTLPVPTNDKISGITNETSFIAKVNNISNITKNDIKENSRIDLRFLIWHYYPKYILQHPFGVGPNSSWDFGFRDKDGVRFYFGPDSTYLVVGLWGGLLGIMSYLYILYSAFVELGKRWKRISDAMSLALLGILFTLSVALFFDGILSLYWFYVILALSLQKNETADYQIAKPFVKAEENEQ